MIHKKRLRKYLDKQLAGIQNNLKDMHEVVDKEKLHDLRLNAKKVKAVSSFLKESLPDENKYSVKQVKEIFHTAGEIRTAQLNVETLEEQHIKNETFLKNQREVIERDGALLLNNRKRFDKNISSLRKKIGRNLKDIKDKKAIGFYYDNIKILSESLRMIDENNLHDCRKIIKRLLYNLKLLPASLLPLLKLNKDYLDNLQRWIGDWHDTVVTLELLIKAGTSDRGSVDKLTSRKQDQLAKIVHETRDFDDRVMLTKPAE